MKIANIYLWAGVLCFLPISVTAQITPDGSTSTTVTNNGGVSTIEAGEQAGANLFHSFDAFSVTNGNEAFFNNAADIETIFSRVTGGNVSNIDGLVRANNANLFLINPAGVIFGDGARLDIGGAFYGGTADSILFPDGVEFSANDTTAPVLTINAPVGLNLRNNPTEVVVQSSNLNVRAGANLNLFGGNISLENTTINALGSKVHLGAVSGAGIITFDENLNPDFSNVSLADISLNNSQINVNGAGNGEIALDARDLTLSESSQLSGGINADSSDANTQAGNIEINAAETVTLNSGSIIRNNLSAVSSGSAGNISIAAKNLSLADNSRLSTISDGNGNIGNISLAITENTQLDNAEIKSQVSPGGIGNGGSINLNTNSLNLTNKSSIFTNTAGRGNAGSVNIIAGDRITLEGSNFQTRVLAQGVGNAGEIDIQTGSLVLSAGENSFSSLLANTEGQGNAGNITIEAQSDVSLEDRSAIQTQVQAGAVGDAGDIRITTGSFSLKDNQGVGSLLLANTRGQGNAGNITVEAQSNISLEDTSTIQTQVQAGAVGNAGNINITTTNLSLIGESQGSNSSLLANSVGDGSGGNINVNASGNISLNNYGLVLSKASAGEGDAGDIIINSDSLSLVTGSYIISNTGDSLSPEITTNGNAGNVEVNSRIINIDNFSEITSNSLGNSSGKAGNVVINDNQNLTIAGGSNINSLTENNSNGGSIDINSQNIELITGGKIVTATNSGGNAGDITINAGGRIVIDGENPPIPTEELRFIEVILQRWEENTGLFANTTDVSSGNGGNVRITTPQDISIFNGGQIAVDSNGLGNGGNLFISAGDLELNEQSQLLAATEQGQAEQEPSNINLQIEDVLSLKGDSTISAQASNNANGGNVTIDAEFVIAFPPGDNGNDIIASAAEGSGGRIDITAQEIFGIQEGKADLGNNTNDLDVSSDFGFDGNLSIDTPDVSATEGLRDLPVNAIVPEDNVQQACSASNLNGNSSLSLQGRGGVPANPISTLSSDNILSDGKLSQANQGNADLNTYIGFTTDSSSIKTAQGEIYPAQGALVTNTGEIILTRSVPERSQSTNIASSCLAN